MTDTAEQIQDRLLSLDEPDIPFRCTRRSVLVYTCIFLIFCAGVALIVPGILYLQVAPPIIPFKFQFNVCRSATELNNGLTAYVSAPTCTANLTASEPQTFMVPPSLLGSGQPYEPVFFISHGVDAVLSFVVTVDEINKGVLTETATTSLQVQPQVIAGGTLLEVRRLATMDKSCTDQCTFLPTRSLLQYALPTEARDQTKRSVYTAPMGLTLQAFEARDNATTPIVPDILVEWQASGMSDDTLTGLILLGIGLLLADTMPAAAYFYTQHHKREQLEKLKDLSDVLTDEERRALGMPT